MDHKLIDYLQKFITEDRLYRLKSVLDRRTSYITIVLEDLHYSQNASSIIRHCDAFGIQNLHIIENKNKFKIKNHAIRGTLKWIDLKYHNELKENSLHTIESLRSRGYRIVATSPHIKGMSASTIKLDKGKVALFFGNERDGLSKEIMNNADEFLYIPMEGFVESLNISASCAIILQQLSERLRNSSLKWRLNNRERDEILYQWLKKSIKKSKSVINDYKQRSLNN